jgi:D-amino-acid dehydrogenase
MMSKKTAIIGGGAIGLFAAFYLNRLGHDVTVIDQARIPGIAACSSGNAGLIVPSHFVPLASPGVLKEGLKNLFNPSAPFGLKWSFNPELFGWLWNFYKSSMSRNLDQKTAFLAEMHLISRQLYREIQENQGINLSLSLSGLTMVSQKEKTFNNDIRIAEKSIALGIPAEIWSAEKYRNLNITLDPQLAGAVFYPLDGKIDPLPMLNNLKQWLSEHGVTFIENSGLFRWDASGTNIRSVALAQGDLEADNFLICAGDQSAEVLKNLGLSVPLQPAKGFSYLFKNNPYTVSHPTLLQDAHIAITPYDFHTRIAGNFLLGNRESNIPRKRLKDIYNGVKNSYPGWNAPMPAINHAWSGNRPVSPDGIPMIGTSSIYRNLSLATGHAMMGISLAPVSGSMIAEAINGSTKYSAFQPFLAPDRFGNRF